ncbi:hypothetical protein L218DRAFT_962860 [Marasmius fiardii PR-910]|nr:hypothetical protein L218DRAFT_962860 [Marasmius fiardii PR-910]
MADASSAATFLGIVEALDHQRMVSYLDVVSATLLVYDIIINLPAEIEHVWMKKWSFLTVLYIVQRYFPLFDSVVVVLRNDLGVNLSTSYCTLNYKIAGCMSYPPFMLSPEMDFLPLIGSYIAGLMLSELILTLRVWTVWERSFPAGIALMTFFLSCWVPGYVFLGKFLSAMEFASPPFFFRGCFVVGGSDILYLCWVLMIVYEAGTLIMILIPGVRVYRRGGRTELIVTVYRDGIIYYVLILLLSMINVVVIRTLPYFVLLLNSLVRVLHSLLASRAILHIRQIGLQDSTHQTMSQNHSYEVRMDTVSFPSHAEPTRF